MRSAVTVLLAAFALATNSVNAEEKKPRLVNLARLSIARVSVSSVNGDRAIDDQFYGAQRLFDADSEFINGINYDSWLSESSPAWVVVRFTRPVTFSGLVVTIKKDHWNDPGRPGPMRLQLRGEAGRLLGLSPVVASEGVYVPAHPVDGVREVKMYFAGTGFALDEIEVMGPPPSDLDLTPRTPPVDAEPELPTAEPTETGKGPRTAFIKAIAEMRVEKLRVIRAAINGDAKDHARASDWFRLNEAMKELIEFLGDEKGLTSIIKEVRPLGISVGTCAQEPPWDVGVEGYNKYLKLWSNGPDADQAWWWARVQHSDYCEGEFEGTEEEYVETSETMKAFLEKFPKSRFAPEAEKTMKEAMDELRSILKSRKEKNPQ